MNVILRNFTVFLLVTLAISISDIYAQNRAYQVSDRQIQTLLDRIAADTDRFKTQVDRSLDNSNLDGTQREDSINSIVQNFESATDRLSDNFSSRRSAAADVEEVLRRAEFINSFVRNNSRTSRAAQTTWTQIRADLNTLAGYYRVTPRWDDTISAPSGQGRGVTVSNAQIRTALVRLKQRSTSFRVSFERWSRNRRNEIDSNTEVSQSIIEFDRALDTLSRSSNGRNPDSVEAVLNPSSEIDAYISANRTNADVLSKWNLVRSDLTMLAGYYRTSWDGNRGINSNAGQQPGNYPVQQSGNFDSRISGTYRLNAGLSDNVTTVVNRAIASASYNANQRDRIRQNLERRLVSPETLMLEKRGQQVTMSSTNAQSLTLNADGIKQIETSPNGRSVTTSVTATATDLTINYEGDRMNDYYVSFMPTSNGQLKVTRRVYIENQNETVSVTSLYDKTSQSAQWNTNTNDYPANTSSTIVNDFYIPNNTSLVATLDSALSTKTAKDGDRFSMTVNSPSRYNGAVIEGNVVGEKSGVVSGRANLSVNFNTIRLLDGKTYRFAGIVDQVRETNGNVVNVNNEGAIRDESQTKKTVTRAGIGAGLGAIIGAIAGGGSGAAIGAGVGAGAGAGTVILQGRDNLDLATGSQFTITSTAPASVGSR